VKKVLKIALILLVVFVVAASWVIYEKKMHIWLPDYVVGLMRKNFARTENNGPKHIIFAFVDHYEPYFATNSDEKAEKRVRAWVDGYPRTASSHVAADGTHPQHTWFYPQEMLRNDLLFMKEISCLSRKGFGELEMHLHHSDDTSDSFRQKIEDWKEACGHVEGNGGRRKLAYIAGNWALDNSRLENGLNYSGVNDELRVLKEEGCFGDFTFPSLGHTSQPAKVNSLYYAIDDPFKPKSYNTGIDLEVGKKQTGDLLIAEGPLAVVWYYFSEKFRPSLDDGNICDTYPPFKERVDTWIDCNIHVKGQPNWVFVKIFTHGCEDWTIPVVLGEPMDEMFTYLETKYNDGEEYILHYVTAREFYNIAKAAEAGMNGNPNDYRDFIIEPYIEDLEHGIVESKRILEEKLNGEG